jgi:hypothetical protein
MSGSFCFCLADLLTYSAGYALGAKKTQ